MKKGIYFFVLLILTTSVYGEQQDFDFSSYTLPDFHRQGLEFTFPGLTISAESSETDGEEAYRTDFSTSLGGHYFGYFYREKWETDYHLRGDIGYTLFKDNNDSRHEKLYGLAASFDGRYYIGGRFFVLAGEEFRYEEEYTNYRETDKRYYKTENRLQGGIGYGRVFDMSAMVRALIIIDELYHNDLLTRYPADKDLRALGDLVCELEEGRVLDSRLKRMEDFKRIDAFLRERNLLREENIEYFAILQDMMLMFYEFEVRRLNGSRLSSAFGYQKSHVYRRWMDGVQSKETENGPFFSASAFYYKIINRFLSFGAGAEWRSADYDHTGMNMASQNAREESVMLETGLSYYPDTRSYFQLSYGYYFSKKDEGEIELHRSKVHRFGARAYYALTTRLTLESQAILSHRKEKELIQDDERRVWGTDLYLILGYKVF